jgi:hypothetical protein
MAWSRLACHPGGSFGSFCAVSLGWLVVVLDVEPPPQPATGTTMARATIAAMAVFSRI